MKINSDTSVGDYNEAMQVWLHCFNCDPKYIPHVFENCYACPLMNTYDLVEARKRNDKDTRSA